MYTTAYFPFSDDNIKKIMQYYTLALTQNIFLGYTNSCVYVIFSSVKARKKLRYEKKTVLYFLNRPNGCHLETSSDNDSGRYFPE